MRTGQQNHTDNLTEEQEVEERSGRMVCVCVRTCWLTCRHTLTHRPLSPAAPVFLGFLPGSPPTTCPLSVGCSEFLTMAPMLTEGVQEMCTHIHTHTHSLASTSRSTWKTMSISAWICGPSFQPAINYQCDITWGSMVKYRNKNLHPG